MGPQGIVQVLERYAEHIAAPVQCGVNVERIEQATSDSDPQARFIVHTGDRQITAQNVIIATGPYQRTLIPDLSEQLPRRIRQLPASAYTNAQSLPAGGVMVVGAGGSGVQITEDLIAAGRDTWLCVGHFKRMPRTYRGRDIMDWFEALNLTNQPVVDRDPNDHSPLLTGVNGGYEVDLRRIVAQGGQLLGRLEGVNGEDVTLGDQLMTHMLAAERAYDELVLGIETALKARGDDLGPAPAPPAAPGPMPPEPPTQLNLADAHISSVIWATGYRVDFSWVHCGEYLADGMPVQQRGVSTVPGLYHLGLAFLYSARSSFFWGVGEDAEHIVQNINQTA